MSTSFIIVNKKYERNPNDLILEKEEGKSEIVIDQIHNLQKIISLAHDALTVVINEAQFLNLSSQNALLKTLEEPPENTVIKLYVDNEDNLLPTVISRCQIIKTEDQSPNLKTSSQSQEVLDLILETKVKEGFSWAEKIKDRQEAIQIIEELLRLKSSVPVYRKLQKAKKYLAANGDVRLTLENLFISM